MVADMLADMKVDKVADKKKLADMLLHMAADKVDGMVDDMGADRKKTNWLTWSWTWWPTRR